MWNLAHFINNVVIIDEVGIAIPGGDFHLIDVDGNEIKEPFITGE